MQLIVHGRNMEVTNWIEEYARKRVKRLERYLPQLDEVRAELAHTPTRAAGDRFTVQVTMWSNGQILRAEESTSDVFASIDAAVDKIAEQVRRFKGRYQKNRRRASAAVQMKAEMEPTQSEAELEEEESTTPAGKIVRRKEFLMQPMKEEEAVEQMELLGHDFFIFFNPATNTPNVVYKRRSGEYGILQPQLG
ncbi:MAG: ribosome-associated translation inhibitor RaiA [Caldilineaceae bacterium]